MAEQDTIPAGAETPNAKSSSGKPLVQYALVMAFVLIVVLVESAIALLLFPSAEDTEAMAQALQAEQSKPDPIVGGPEMDLEEEADEELKKKEVELGDFEVSSYQPLSNTTIRISVQLFGLVEAEDVDSVQTILDEREARVREQVNIILRGAEITDLTDPGLGLIKRKILEKTNRVLGKPLLQQIVLSDFSFMEQ